MEGLILEEVPVLRGGVGFLPSVGSEVFISFVGVDYMPFVMGVWESGKESGIKNGGEKALGGILVIENGKIRVRIKSLILEKF